MGQCLRICEGTFWLKMIVVKLAAKDFMSHLTPYNFATNDPIDITHNHLKMADSIAILVQILSILINSLNVERCTLNRRIYNKKINRCNIFSLKVMTVLCWKITNIANFPNLKQS